MELYNGRSDFLGEKSISVKSESYVVAIGFSTPPLSKTIYMYFNRALLAKEELKNDQPEYSMYLALSIKMC